MRKNNNDLSASLLASFDSTPNRSLTSVQSDLHKSHDRPAKNTKTALKAVKPHSETKKNKALRSTVSYQQTEADAADEILALLKDEAGIRGGFSDAVKIALRLCPLDRDLIAQAWSDTKTEDGRVMRHKV